jgi:hypothetical protein
VHGLDDFGVASAGVLLSSSPFIAIPNHITLLEAANSTNTHEAWLVCDEPVGSVCMIPSYTYQDY